MGEVGFIPASGEASIPTCSAERPEPYRPANGCEGADFMADFCNRCVHDSAFRDGTGESCEIAANTMVYDEDDGAYPREWIYAATGYPTCTAFEPEGEK